LSQKTLCGTVSSKNEDFHSFNHTKEFEKNAALSVHFTSVLISHDHRFSHDLLVTLRNLGNQEMEAKYHDHKLVENPEKPNEGNHCK